MIRVNQSGFEELDHQREVANDSHFASKREVSFWQTIMRKMIAIDVIFLLLTAKGRIQARENLRSELTHQRNALFGRRGPPAERVAFRDHHIVVDETEVAIVLLATTVDAVLVCQAAPETDAREIALAVVDA